MEELIYLCRQCGEVFRLPADSAHTPEKELQCPQCGDSQVKELPSWVPTGSDLLKVPQEWEYECQQCKNRFRLPVPGSPSQEKKIKCHACGAEHIHRLTATGYKPLYCG
jgi:DNA-directed RNA polymerase subunit RPC12/RpoP